MYLVPSQRFIYFGKNNKLNYAYHANRNSNFPSAIQTVIILWWIVQTIKATHHACLIGRTSASGRHGWWSGRARICPTIVFVAAISAVIISITEPASRDARVVRAWKLVSLAESCKKDIFNDFQRLHPPPLKKLIRYVKTTLHCARIALPTSRNWVHGWSETRYSAGGTCGFVTSVRTVHYPITNKIVIYTRLTVDTMKILSPTRIWKNKSEIRYIISGCYHLADYQIRQMYYFVPYRTRRQICRKVQILSASRCHPLWIPGTNFVQTTRRLLLCGRNIYQSIWLPYSVHRIYSNSHSCS